jgi:foldase protein PrsA
MMQRTTMPVTKLASICVGILCLTLSTISCGDNGDEEAEAQRVVATVNGTPITEAQLIERLTYGPGPRVLLRMIDSRLIETEAVRRGISPTREQVELKLSQAASRFGSEHELAAMLRQRGGSLAELKDRLRVDAMLDAIALDEVAVQDEEIEQYYQEHIGEFSHGEQVRARMILTETQENAETIRGALEAGGDFAGLAQTLSIDPGTAEQGGDMGYFEREAYAAEIANVAFALEPGQVSEVFAVPDGYCLIKVEDRRLAGAESLAEVREQIISRLRHGGRDQMRQEWLIKRRQQAHLSIPDPRMREILVPLFEANPPPNPFEF